MKAVDNHNHPWATIHLYRDRPALLTHRAYDMIYFGVEVLIFYCKLPKCHMSTANR